MVGISHFDPVYLQPGSGHFFQITADGVSTIRSSSLGNFNIEVGATAPDRTETSRRAGPDWQQLLFSAMGVERSGRQFTIAVAADMLPIRERIDAFLLRYTLLTLTMFAVLLALQVWIVRRTLAPLRRAQADVVRLEHGEITQLGESVPSEVLPKIRKINHLLAVLGERLRRSHEALGNLSHALKTPLTLLTLMSDHESIRADPALRTQIQEQLRVLGSSRDRELRRARVAGLSSRHCHHDFTRGTISQRPRRPHRACWKPARQCLQMGAPQDRCEHRHGCSGRIPARHRGRRSRMCGRGSGADRSTGGTLGRGEGRSRAGSGHRPQHRLQLRWRIVSWPLQPPWWHARFGLDPRRWRLWLASARPRQARARFLNGKKPIAGIKAELRMA